MVFLPKPNGRKGAMKIIQVENVTGTGELVLEVVIFPPELIH